MPLPVIEPVRPILRKHIPRGREWRYEPKLDGFRGTLYFESGKAFFRSKTMKKMSRFQPLADTLAEHLGGVVDDVIVDGEIIVLDDQGMIDFYALMQARGEPQYAAFDLLWRDGVDLRDESYLDRKKGLRMLLKKVSPIGIVDNHRSPALFEAATRMDLEGVVAKRVDGSYGPDTEWVKVKNGEYSQTEGRAEMFHRRA